MSVARKILWNTASQMIGKIFLGVIGIITVKLATTYLGKSGYGFYKSVFEFMAFFGIAADMGLYTIGVREMSKDPKNEAKILGNLLTIRTIFILVICIVAITASMFVPEFQDATAIWAVAIVALGTVFAILTGTISSVLQVHLKMQYNSFASVIGKLVAFSYMIVVIFILYKHAGYYDINAHLMQEISPFLVIKNSYKIYGEVFYQLLFAGVFGNLAMFLTTYYYTRKIVKIKYRFDFDFWKDVVWKALPYGIALVLNMIYFRIGSIMLLLMKGKEYVGIYGVPLTMLEAAGIVPLYFMNSMLPVLTRALKENKEKYQKIIQYSFDFLVMGSLPIVVGTFILAYPLIKLISTPEFLTRADEGFYGSDTVLQILIFAILFSFVNSLFGYILVASNNQSKILSRNLIGAILTVVLNFILIPFIDVRGAAFANVFTELYVAIASYFIAKHYIDFNINFGKTFKVIFSALVMGLVVYLLKDPTYYWYNLQNKNLLILIPLGGIIYGGMLFLTRTITKDMLDMVRRKPVLVKKDIPNEIPPIEL